MKKLICQRCGHEWEYKGKSKYFTSCPQCKTSVKVNRIKMDRGVHPNKTIFEMVMDLKKDVNNLKREAKKKKS